MKLKDAILLAAAALNVDGVLTGERPETDKLFLQCANNCLDEIAAEYIRLEESKKVMATDGKIYYSELSETVFDIIDVRKDGTRVTYRLMPSYIEVGEGEYTVRFCTRPLTLESDDDVPFPLKLTPRILSYGIAAEYLLCNGFYDEAVTYDKRFKDALNHSAYGKAEKRIRRRRWLE